jgi:paraquat-inducible protein B
MSKQANVTLIGAFVAGAIVLVVTGLLVFGSGRLFSNTKKFVLFFDGSIKGLNVGAPVDFKGVRVGSVIGIRVLFKQDDLSLRIPVFIEIDPKRLSEYMPEVGVTKLPGSRPIIELLVEQGLRAQLVTQSLVTGLLSVDLDFHPDKPATYVELELGYPELPTVPSQLEAITKVLENLPLEDIVEKFHSALSGIDRLVNSPKLDEAITNLNGVLADGQKLVKNFDSQAQRVGEDAHKLLVELNRQAGPLATELRGGVQDTRAFIGKLDKNIVPVATSLEQTLKTAQAALKQAETTLASVDGMFNERSGLTVELSAMLNELSGAARSIRVLSDYIERHPEALIRGKRPEDGKR